VEIECPGVRREQVAVMATVGGAVVQIQGWRRWRAAFYYGCDLQESAVDFECGRLALTFRPSPVSSPCGVGKLAATVTPERIAASHTAGSECATPLSPKAAPPCCCLALPPPPAYDMASTDQDGDFDLASARTLARFEWPSEGSLVSDTNVRQAASSPALVPSRRLRPPWPPEASERASLRSWMEADCH